MVIYTLNTLTGLKMTMHDSIHLKAQKEENDSN